MAKLVLALRETTEHPEAVDAGTVRLVGTDRSEIVKLTRKLLDDTAFDDSMARAVNPYGDGHAAARIAKYEPYLRAARRRVAAEWRAACPEIWKNAGGE